MMVVYGYARLVGYDAKLELVPDLLESFEIVGRPHLHAAAAPGPPLVRRPAVHHRGFPLLLGGRRQQPGALARGPAAATCWSTASRRKVEVLDETDGALHAGRSPIPIFLPALAGAVAAVHLPAGALPEAVPRQVHRPRTRRRRSRGEAGQRNWAALHNRQDNMYRTTIPTCRRCSPG